MPITFDGEMSINITLDGEFGSLQYYSDYHQYAGAATVIPSQSEQVLLTNGLIMPSNVVVKPIPSNYGLITYNGSFIRVS